MAYILDEVWVNNGQLIVAEVGEVPTALGDGIGKVRHSAYIEGPLQVGNTGDFTSAEGTVMIGKDGNMRTSKALFVKGDVKLKDRKNAYDEINEGTNHVVIATYGVAAVGINIPRIFNLVLIEPGKSFVRVIQSIGRGVRKAKDKDFVQIWDLTSTCKFAKRHLTQRKKFYKEAQYPFTIEKVDWQ